MIHVIIIYSILYADIFNICKYQNKKTNLWAKHTKETGHTFEFKWENFTKNKQQQNHAIQIRNWNSTKLQATEVNFKVPITWKFLIDSSQNNKQQNSQPVTLTLPQQQPENKLRK